MARFRAPACYNGDGLALGDYCQPPHKDHWTLIDREEAYR